MLKRCIDIESLRALLKAPKKADITILDEAKEPFGTISLVKTLIKVNHTRDQILLHLVVELSATKGTRVCPIFDSHSESLGGQTILGAEQVLRYQVTDISIKKIGTVFRNVFYSITVQSEGGYRDWGDPHWRSSDLSVGPFEPYVRVIAFSKETDLNQIVHHTICTST